MNSLERLFSPKSIVVVGASSKKGKVGYELLKNLVENGYDGELYGLNPKGGEAFNIKFYTKIEELPSGIDLALFATSGAVALDVLESLATRGLGSAIIYASGFAEIGNEDMQYRLMRIIQDFGVRIIGPNCAGIVNNLERVYASFVPNVERGVISMASQSGAFSAVVTNYLGLKGVGLASLATLGNKVDVDEADFLKYFSRYEDVKSFILYIEGLKPREGRELAKTIRAIHKPVVILKGGATEGVERAVYSHTASLTGDFKIIKAILEGVGAYFTHDYIELADVAEATAYLKPPRDGEIGIVTNGGGPGVIAVDHLHKLGIRLGRTPKHVMERLDHLKPYMVKTNPIDLTADGNEDYYYHTIKALMETDWPGIIYALHVPPSFIDPYKVAKAVGEAYIESNMAKPIVPLFMGVDIKKIAKTLHSYGLPSPTTHRSASMAVDYLTKLGRFT